MVVIAAREARAVGESVSVSLVADPTADENPRDTAATDIDAPAGAGMVTLPNGWVPNGAPPNIYAVGHPVVRETASTAETLVAAMICAVSDPA